MVIVNLKTVKKMRGIDMWLTQANRSLCKLKSGDVLEPIFGSKLISKSEWLFKLEFLSNKDNKVCLQDFEIVKCIGKGGFAKVFKGEIKYMRKVLFNSEKKINRVNLCHESYRKDQNCEDKKSTLGISRIKHNVKIRLSIFDQALLRFSIGNLLVVLIVL